MANEITASVNLSASKSGWQTIRSASASITMTGSYAVTGVQSIGTTAETISKGDITTIGMVYFKNLDSTNFVLLDGADDAYPIKLKAGEACLLRWNSASVYAKADTSACLVEYILIED